MKNIIYTLTVLLVSCSTTMNAQTIIPLENETIDKIEGAYYKDVNGLLDPYLGNWEVTFDEGTKKVNFNFFKYKHDWGDHYTDRIRGSYEVRNTATNEVIEYNTGTKLLGVGSPNNSSYGLAYFGKENCEINIDIELYKIEGNPNQLTWFPWTLSITPAIIEGGNDCPEEVYSFNLPLEEVTLTKVE